MDRLALPVRDPARSRNAAGFALALGPSDQPVDPPPEYVSVKCRDPDGYVVEAAWEPAR
jgi:hypothetical protein